MKGHVPPTPRVIKDRAIIRPVRWATEMKRAIKNRKKPRAPRKVKP